MSALKPFTSGYMKPPRNRQFQKGQSGNPAGRPKRVDDPFTALNKVLARKIAVSGEPKKIVVRDALLRCLRERALAGERKAIALNHRVLAMIEAEFPQNKYQIDVLEEMSKFQEDMRARVAAKKTPEPADDN